MRPPDSDNTRTGAGTASFAGSAHSRPELPNEYVAPGSELEQQIADIWEGILGIDPVGIHDDFFELGGHSLMATQVVSRLRSLLQLDVPVRVLLEKPTVAELAADIEQHWHERRVTLVPISSAQEQEDAQKILANFSALSDQEVDMLLRESMREG